MRSSVFLFVSALTLWSVDLTAAPTHGLCATNFKAVARLRRSPDYKNNHQLLIWMYDEAGLQNASNRMRTKIEQTLSRGHVAAEPSKVKVDRGGLMNALNFGDGIKALWKLKTSGTIRDVTTYRFDRFLGANVVPISTELSYEGKQIVVQLYVPGTDGEALKTNPHHLSLFDYLLNHRDRHGDNHLTFHGRTIVIDNENAFDTKQSFDLKPPDFPGMVLEALQKDSPSTAASIIATALISRGFVEKLKSATDSEWRLVLKELTTDEFSQFLVRKNNAVSAIRLAESKLGDAIYPVGPFSALSRNPWAAMIARIQEARRDPRVPVDVQNRLRLALDLIETETEFQKPLTVTQRQRIDAALHELEAYL